ncbi:hypothetical protein HK102_007167, partial [Quaeritorhiza haematococci]
MVSFWSHTFTYAHSWPAVTQAIFQKYPNPFARHVLSSDVIDRTVDPETGVMKTTRLFLKKGIIPKWGRHLLNVSEAFIIEQTIVDPRSKTMITVTRNLSHKKVMLVEETQVIRPNPSNPDTMTVVNTSARIVSNMGWAPITSRIEGFGLSKFKDNALR